MKRHPRYQLRLLPKELDVHPAKVHLPLCNSDAYNRDLTLLDENDVHSESGWEHRLETLFRSQTVQMWNSSVTLQHQVSGGDFIVAHYQAFGK